MHRICLRIILLFSFLCVLTISDTVSAGYDQDVENAKTLLIHDEFIITQENTKVTRMFQSRWFPYCPSLSFLRVSIYSCPSTV